MNDEDKKAFLDDFKKADKNQKLDMWFFALEQEAIWEELLTEMSMVAQMQNPMKGKSSDDE